MKTKEIFKNDKPESNNIKNDKNNTNNIQLNKNKINLILPNTERMFITKIIIKDNPKKIKLINNKKPSDIPFSSVSNTYYFCTKQKIAEKKKKSNNSVISSNIDININMKKNKNKNNSIENKIKKNNSNLPNKNIKYMKIPIIQKNKNQNPNPNKVLSDKTKRKNFSYLKKITKKNIIKKSEENQNQKSDKNIYNIGLKNKNNKLYKINIKKKKKNLYGINGINDINGIKDISHKRCFSFKETDNCNKTSNTNIKKYQNKFKNKSTQHNIINKKKDLNNINNKYSNSNINITSFNSDVTTNQNRIKSSFLKNEIYKRINKKDNNILVYIKGFKKHFGKEENCPLCITRENNATKRLKILSLNNNNFDNLNNISYNKKYRSNINFYDLQDEIDNKEFHNFFIKELNKNKYIDDEILFKKDIINKQKKRPSNSQYSMSLPINSKIKQDKKELFPVIYNYFES